MPEPYILGELRHNTTSLGWRMNYPWYMVHFIYFRNKTFFVCQERKLKFSATVWYKVWCTLNRTTHKLWLWLYYRLWQILISYCKFIMPKALKWDMLSLSISIFHWDIPKNEWKDLKIFLHEFTSFDNFAFFEFLCFWRFVP